MRMVKKIRLKDAFAAIAVIIRFSLIADLYKDPGSRDIRYLRLRPALQSMDGGYDTSFSRRAGIGDRSRGRQPDPASGLEMQALCSHGYRQGAPGSPRNGLLHRPILETAQLRPCEPRDFLPFAGAMDTVVCLNVLEHWRTMPRALKNIYNALERRWTGDYSGSVRAGTVRPDGRRAGTLPALSQRTTPAAIGGGGLSG